MANRYDTPVQLDFINTYVPIPFEQLYKLGKAANDRVDEALSDFTTALDKFGEFRSRSAIDMQRWNDLTINPQKALIEQMAKNPELIKDKAFQSQLKSSIANVDRTKLSLLKQNAAAYDEYEKLKQKLMIAGKYNPTWHDIDFSNYDTLGDGLHAGKGLFEATPMPYADLNELSKPYMDQLKPGFLRSDGVYDYTGIAASDLERVANAHLTDIANTPQGQMHMQMFMRNNPDATPEQALAWLRNAIIDSNQDRLIINRDINDLYKMRVAASLSNKGKTGKGATEESSLPTPYDMQFMSTTRDSENHLLGDHRISNVIARKRELEATQAEIMSQYQAGAIDEATANAALKQLNEDAKTLVEDRKFAVKQILAENTGIGSQFNKEEVKIKKHNLANGVFKTFWDISGTVDVPTFRDYYTEKYGNPKNYFKIDGVDNEVYLTQSLAGFDNMYTNIAEIAGIGDKIFNSDEMMYDDGYGHEVNLFRELERKGGFVRPLYKGIPSDRNGVNTLSVGVEVFVPVANLNDDAVKKIKKEFGDDAIVDVEVDNEGTEVEFARLYMLQAMPRNSVDAVHFNNLVNKYSINATHSADNAATSISDHLYK